MGEATTVNAAAYAAQPPSPFDMIGGAAAVTTLVEHFYDLVATDPAYDALHRMHAPDLGPVRTALAGFLTGWLGGPRDWFIANPGRCMMSVHGNLGVTRETADQWTSAMTRAINTTVANPDFGAAMGEALCRMANGMVSRR